MNELKIYYPFKPFRVAQRWGNPNPAYQKFGFSLHNGVDAHVGGARTFPLYCPVEGFRVLLVRNFPEGGGNEMWLVSKQPLQMFERKCHAYIVLAHAEKILVPVGYEPALGELIMIADNTGFSTGPHTHFGLYRVDYDSMRINYLDKNEANGSFEPSLFFTGSYAVDKATTGILVKSGFRYLAYLLGK